MVSRYPNRLLIVSIVMTDGIIRVWAPGTDGKLRPVPKRVPNNVQNTGNNTNLGTGLSRGGAGDRPGTQYFTDPFDREYRTQGANIRQQPSSLASNPTSRASNPISRPGLDRVAQRSVVSPGRPRRQSQDSSQYYGETELEPYEEFKNFTIPRWSQCLEELPWSQNPSPDPREDSGPITTENSNSIPTEMMKPTLTQIDPQDQLPEHLHDGRPICHRRTMFENSYCPSCLAYENAAAFPF
ncbi:hypothetical protein GGR50DRAFT_170454 [Xylaria sp. CBS 124048]|nr:hypothetical protein GGR50DRAFT_170454 [Xylaria sp. CBS 124048]